MSRLARATARLFQSQRTNDGYAATIARGVSSCSATVVLGQPADDAVDLQGFTVEAGRRDILVAAADYKPTGSASDPQLDDRITITSLGLVLRVVARNGEKVFSPADPEGTELRVFCTEK